jgi:hypothetical protein
MRKITSRKKQEKKQKRNQLIGGIVLMSILFLSLIGYGLGGKGIKKNKVTYNGQEFVEENGYWITELGDFVFSFMYNPNEIENIGAGLNFLNEYSGKPLYISSEDIRSSSEIYRNLVDQNKIVLRMQLACLEGEICENEELPIKTCEDNFIIIQEAETTNVRQEDNCIFIEGRFENLAKITDGFLLSIIGLQ